MQHLSAQLQLLL